MSKFGIKSLVLGLILLNATPAFAVSQKVLNAWQAVMASVENGSTRQITAGDVSELNLQSIIDKTIVDLIESAFHLPDYDANTTWSQYLDLAEKFDKMDRVKKSYVLKAKIQYVQGELRAFRRPDRNNQIMKLVEPAPTPITSYDQLGLTDSNPELAASTKAIFESAAEYEAAHLSDAEKIEFWIYMGGIDTKYAPQKSQLSERLKQMLVSNNEWSTFGGQIRATAIEHLKLYPTPETVEMIVVLMDEIMHTMDGRYTAMVAKDALLELSQNAANHPALFKGLESGIEKLKKGKAAHYVIKGASDFLTALGPNPCSELGTTQADAINKFLKLVQFWK